MQWLIARFGLTVVQGILGAAGIASLVGWFAFSQQEKGAAKVVAKIEKKATANALKADTARRTVDKLPDDQLHDRRFRPD